MSTPIDDGGPAFPIPDSHLPNGEIYYGRMGMSLRDYLAGQALVGLLAQNSSCAHQWAPGKAYGIADAMLAARKQKADQ